MVKKLLYLRHGPKDENKNLSPEGYEQARNLRLPFSHTAITDVFTGPLARTVQTALAICCVGLEDAIVHPTIMNIGDDALFGWMANAEFRKATAKGTPNILAMQSSHSADKVQSVQEKAKEAVLKMFDAMAKFGTALAVGHDPMIPLAARAFGLEVLQLNPLQGVIFNKDKEGNITAQLFV